MDRLEGPAGDIAELDWNSDLPDVLHALCRLLRLHANASSNRVLGIARAAYHELDRFPWQHDYLNEKSELLAAFAYIAWNECRKSCRYAEMVSFADRCERHVVEQQAPRDFLALPYDERSEPLNERFLSDPAVVLASLTKLSRSRDLAPDTVASEAPLLRQWVLGSRRQLSANEVAWFAAELAIFGSAASRILGELSEAERWLSLAKCTLPQDRSAKILEAQVEYARLAILHESEKSLSVVDAIPALLETLRALGMERDAAKAALLEAYALKTLGRDEALARFQGLLKRSAVMQDPLLLGLCLVNVGDLSARQGHTSFAMSCFAEAKPLLETTGVRWGLAYLFGVVGEVLRDQGHLGAAIEGYRAAIKTYDEGMTSRQAAYVRVILAETLIAAGREAEAVVEILAALPVIERESLTLEGITAVALLRASLGQHQTDPSVLRELREQLDRVRKGGEL